MASVTRHGDWMHAWMETPISRGHLRLRFVDAMQPELATEVRPLTIDREPIGEHPAAGVNPSFLFDEIRHAHCHFAAKARLREVLYDPSGDARAGMYAHMIVRAAEAWFESARTPVTANITIRPMQPEDQPYFLAIARAVARRGDTYVFDETTTDAELADYWLHHGEVRVAVMDGRVVGGYLLKPNQPWRGSHIANAGYIVDESVRGGGIGRLLCRDSVRRATELGFRGIQFNLVVETNTGAVGLWLSEGFRIIGTVPGVFRHAEGRFVGAHVMFRELAGSPVD